MFKVILVFFGALSLVACVSPVSMGISESAWQSYSPDQQKKIKSGYYQNLGSKKAAEKIVSDGSELEVKVSGGQINMPPFANATQYKPVTFRLQSGECQTLTVNELSGDKTTTLQACFWNKKLYIDPSRYDPTKHAGSLLLHYSPIWDRGFTYPDVSSSGYAKMQHVNVSVRRSGGNEELEDHRD